MYNDNISEWRAKSMAGGRGHDIMNIYMNGNLRDDAEGTRVGEREEFESVVQIRHDDDAWRGAVVVDGWTRTTVIW